MSWFTLHKKACIVVCAVIGIALLGVLSAWGLSVNNKSFQAFDESEVPQFNVKVECVGWNKQSTPIVVHVDGSTEKGEAVSKDITVEPNTNVATGLECGTYSLSIKYGTIMLSDGSLMDGATTTAENNILFEATEKTSVLTYTPNTVVDDHAVLAKKYSDALTAINDIIATDGTNSTLDALKTKATEELAAHEAQVAAAAKAAEEEKESEEDREDEADSEANAEAGAQTESESRSFGIVGWIPGDTYSDSSSNASQLEPEPAPSEPTQDATTDTGAGTNPDQWTEGAPSAGESAGATFE